MAPKSSKTQSTKKTLKKILKKKNLIYNICPELMHKSKNPQVTL